MEHGIDLNLTNFRDCLFVIVPVLNSTFSNCYNQCLSLFKQKNKVVRFEDFFDLELANVLLSGESNINPE